MKEVYVLILKTPGGSISDKFEFDTLEEAEAEKSSINHITAISTRIKL